MDTSKENLQSIYHYLKQNIKSAQTKSDLIPYINTLTNIQHLKEFISISLDKQYRIAQSKPSSLERDTLRLLFISLPTENTKTHHNDLYPYSKPRLSPNIRSEPNLHSNSTQYEDTLHIDDWRYNHINKELLYASNAESDDHWTVDEDESEHGVEFAIAGHGDTTIIYTDNEQTDHEEDMNMVLLHGLNIDEIKESDPESSHSSNCSQSIETFDFKPITEMIQNGEKQGIVIKSQFAEKSDNHVLLVQILNMNIDKMTVSKVKIIFHKNCVGIRCRKSDIILPSFVKYNHGFAFVCNLELDQDNAMNIMDTSGFDNNIKFVVNTNLFEIKCELNVPIYLFFETRQELEPNRFLFLWKSVPEKQYKLKVVKCKYENVQDMKKLLSSDIYDLWFIHHRRIDGNIKGDILYYSCKINGIIILLEVAVALAGKGTIITRSHDEYKSMLCAQFIRLLIDTF